jgi:predicted  nucleic acid-binding Zn-ribbon protein
MHVNNLTHLLHQAAAVIEAAKQLPDARAEAREAHNKYAALNKQVERLNKEKSDSQETITMLRESMDTMEGQLKEMREEALAEDVESQLLSFT